MRGSVTVIGEGRDTLDQNAEDFGGDLCPEQEFLKNFSPQHTSDQKLPTSAPRPKGNWKRKTNFNGVGINN